MAEFYVPSTSIFNDELSLKEWPMFPWGGFPGILDQFISLATCDSEADPAAVCFTFLVRFCAEIYGYAEGKGPHLYVGETLHPPRLFAVLCGDSSKARKGTSRYPVARLFDRSALPPDKLPTDLPLPARESGGPMSTGEGLAFHLQNDIKQEAQESENSARDKGDKRLVIFDEEFSAALTCLKRTGNTLSMGIRSFWDTGNYAPLTKSTPVSVQNAHLNILTHITRQELIACLDHIQTVNGFANRFLWVCVRRQKLVPVPSRMPEKELSILQQELWRIISFAQKCETITMDKKALELWNNIYPILSRDYPEPIGSLISRAEAQTLRLALVYTLLDGKNLIEESHLGYAWCLWEYAKDSAFYIFSHLNLNGNPSLDQKILTALENGPLTASDLSAYFKRNISKSQMEPALQRLQAQHRINVIKEHNGNSRPITTISLI